MRYLTFPQLVFVCTYVGKFDFFVFSTWKVCFLGLPIVHSSCYLKCLGTCLQSKGAALFSVWSWISTSPSRGDVLHECGHNICHLLYSMKTSSCQLSHKTPSILRLCMPLSSDHSNSIVSPWLLTHFKAGGGGRSRAIGNYSWQDKLSGITSRSNGWGAPRSVMPVKDREPGLLNG